MKERVEENVWYSDPKSPTDVKSRGRVWREVWDHAQKNQSVTGKPELFKGMMNGGWC